MARLVDRSLLLSIVKYDNCSKNHKNPAIDVVARGGVVAHQSPLERRGGSRAETRSATGTDAAPMD